MTSKEKILEEIKDINYAYNDCSKYVTIKDLLDEMEEERKKGKWREIQRYSPTDKAAINECSLCHDTVWMYDGERRWNYCPNCGADMREEDNETN